MTKLVMGVIDIPYRHVDKDTPVKSGKPPVPGQLPKAIKTRRPPKDPVEQAIAESITTGQVATILEEHYGVMAAFYKAHEKEIKGAIADSVRGAMINVLVGGPPPSNPYEGAMEKIKVLFNQFLDSAEIESMGIAGVPTKAALNGVSHRKKHPYSKNNPRRPSFIDTGQFEAAFKCWTQD